jgi:hypothetical protein
MTVRRLLTADAITAGAIVFATSMWASYADTCSQEIDRTQATIDARLEARAAAGSSAAESTAATLHHQPTPNSIAAAEGRLGDLPPDRAAAVFAAMGRAREADHTGDLNACEQALSEVHQILGE